MDLLRLVDVGARDGIDGRWTPFHYAIDVVAFEPDEVECARLNSLRWPYAVRYLPVALGAANGLAATLRICKSPGCTSLLRPNRQLFGQFAYASNMEVVREVPVILERMDAVVPWRPDAIKLDTQGTELDILEGAGSLLGGVIAVELEVEFVPQYEDQPLFADVDAFMRSHGFWLRGLKRSYWRQDASYTHPYGGQLIHGDALYLRQEGLDSPKGHMILAAYNQFDLLARFGARALIPKRPMSARVLSTVLAGYSNRRLRRLVDYLRPDNASDWHDADFF